jgi:transcriptional regulator with XRE-family HTH domain
MSVGSRLRQLRRERGLSVEELAARTRIAARILRSIEQDDFDAVPSGIFLRGYLRACAREVGFDAEALVEQYRTEYEAPPTPQPAVVDSKPSPAAPARLRIEPRLAHASAAPGWPPVAAVPLPPAPDSAAVSSPVPRRAVPGVPELAKPWNWPLRPVALAVGVALLALIVWTANQWRVNTVADRQPASQSGTSTPERPIGTSGNTARSGDTTPVASASSRASSTDAAMRLQLTATRRVWVTAHADGRRVLYRLLEANEQVSLTGTQQINVRVGDAGALLVSLNGSEPRRAGNAGEVRNVAFSRAQPVY